MTGNVHYRIVFSSRPGLTECKDILVDEFEVEADGSISEEAARAALFPWNQQRSNLTAPALAMSNAPP